MNSSAFCKAQYCGVIVHPIRIFLSPSRYRNRTPLITFIAALFTYSAAAATFTTSATLTAFTAPTTSTLSPARLHGGLYTPDRLHNVLQNIHKYRWARQQRDAATSTARIWASKSDEQLWALVPGQALPRTIDVTWDYNHPEKPRIGCLVCGEKIFGFGNYPYSPDIWKKPWKLTCPSCGAVFPTNDFGAYYRSGIDEHGLFNPTRANRALLYNTAHPNPKDPLHTFGVDDGYGYIDANGRAHKFIGYYTWKLWNEICSGVAVLANAYVYTGDKAYARKAAILLDRIADVYPDMDWKPYADRGWYHSDGGTHLGKIGGRIWETAILANFARDYDRILYGTKNNDELFRFLAAKARRFHLPGVKGTRDGFVANVDDGILRAGAAAVKRAQIAGNDGMKQHAIISAAIALDQQPESREWIDWAFNEHGGEIPTIIVGGLDRDGTGDEGAPNYSLLWIDKLLAIAELLRQYPQGGHDLYAEFPQLRQSFTAGWRMLILGAAAPNIGDSGATGLIDRMQCNPNFIARGYQAYHDPYIARAAYDANGGSARNLLLDIFSSAPESLNREIERIARAQPSTLTSGSRNMSGFGLAKLEFGTSKTGSAVWCYYGRNGGHGHHDNLNLGIHAFGFDLAPDLGYPEFATPAWPNRIGWTANTLSHNTVIVDQKPQKDIWDGQPHFFTADENFGTFEISSPHVYPQTQEYTRTVFFVKAPGGNSYAIDIFRVRGGSDHLYSFHGPPGAVAAPELTLETQTTGTYAGEEIPFALNSPAVPLGYSYLYNVQRQHKPPEQFTLDWKVEPGYRGATSRDNIHLRMHVLSPCDDVALADGDPPQNKPFNPRRLRYALLHRAGENLDSTFINVFEPYRAKPFIKQVVQLLPPAKDGTTSDRLSLRIDLMDGSQDLIQSISPGTRQGLTATISHQHVTTSIDTSRFFGRVLTFEKDIRKPATILISGIPASAAASLSGQQIIIANDGKRNACYTIQSAAAEGENIRINCGHISFARQFRERRDYSKGLVYEFHEGTTFTIPLTTSRRTSN